MTLPIINGRRILQRFAVGSSGVPGGPLTVRRKATGTFDGTGTYVPAAGVTTLTISGCSVQQLDPSEKELLPEGFRQTDSIRVYAPEMLQMADPVTGKEADEVDYKGVTYQVLKSEDWMANGGFWKALAVRIGH